jgi:hypothetical protein
MSGAQTNEKEERHQREDNMNTNGKFINIWILCLLVFFNSLPILRKNNQPASLSYSSVCTRGYAGKTRLTFGVKVALSQRKARHGLMYEPDIKITNETIGRRASKYTKSLP